MNGRELLEAIEDDKILSEINFHPKLSAWYASISSLTQERLEQIMNLVTADIHESMQAEKKEALRYQMCNQTAAAGVTIIVGRLQIRIRILLQRKHQRPQARITRIGVQHSL